MCIRDRQIGFRKVYSCVDNIFTIQQVIEQNREFNSPTYFLFIQYVKAFAKVDRQKLCEILNRIRRIHSQLIEVTHAGSHVKVKVNNILREKNIDKSGDCVKCLPLFPFLLNLYLDESIPS